MEGQGGTWAGGWEEVGREKERGGTGEVGRAEAVVVGREGSGGAQVMGATLFREAEGWAGALQHVPRTARWPIGLQWKWPRVTTWKRT